MAKSKFRLRRKNKTKVIRKTGRFDSIDLAVIISNIKLTLANCLSGDVCRAYFLDSCATRFCNRKYNKM